ncbi:hypothetical protein CND06140 [Cryptococcus deneoformans JEC21]|uniref:Secreted protein n=1 Tax=Cryptococcus deneoformans (strain JEC21 / ATCC MYA-565) TaxID=214684 RepID=Q5KHK6_CRYD1|nr:hypothetical protein CND06140 [Cryptococcus neoformans var. neoformans JEC21]AAW43350.1 hypothetical protein CND06140 [Cryptococcus neoformans var. neoformans JEC21]
MRPMMGFHIPLLLLLSCASCRVKVTKLCGRYSFPCLLYVSSSRRFAARGLPRKSRGYGR